MANQDSARVVWHLAAQSLASQSRPGPFTVPLSRDLPSESVVCPCPSCASCRFA